MQQISYNSVEDITDDIRKQLEKQLEKVNRRLEILDMIEEKLVCMKVLTQRVIDEDLTDEEILEINMEVNNLAEQVSLLDMQATELS